MLQTGNEFRIANSNQYDNGFRLGQSTAKFLKSGQVRTKINQEHVLKSTNGKGSHFLSGLEKRKVIKD